MARNLAKKPGPGIPLAMLAANRCPIAIKLPSVTLSSPQNGSKPISLFSIKWVFLTYSKASKQNKSAIENF